MARLLRFAEQKSVLNIEESQWAVRVDVAADAGQEQTDPPVYVSMTRHTSLALRQKQRVGIADETLIRSYKSHMKSTVSQCRERQRPFMRLGYLIRPPPGGAEG